MNILVTGGAGFIGSHVVDAYIEAGHQVVVVDNLFTGKLEHLNPHAKFYRADIRDIQGLRKVFAIEKVDVVSHHAARLSVQGSFANPLAFADVNTLGSLTLLEACRLFGVRRFIYASSGGTLYGEPQYLPVDENHPISPCDPYGVSKHHVEQYLRVYHAHFKLPYTILRYSNVYGPRQNPRGDAGVIAIFTHKMLKQERPVIYGSGEQVRDLVYVDDVVRANLLALSHSNSSIFNIGTGYGTSVNTVFDKLAGLTRFKGSPNHGPARSEVSRIWLDTRKAKSGIAWSAQISLDEGLARTVEFFARDGHN